MKKIALLLTTIASFNLIYAQVGINTNTPDPSSSLDVSSTSSGILIPRLSTTERNAIQNPANGLIIYDKTKNCLSQQISNATSPKWVCITEKTVRFFYLPSLNIDTSTTGTFSLNLYDAYKQQFSQPLVSSAGATGIPYFESASELEYYVTDYDDTVLNTITINANGLMTYRVIGTATACSFVNVVIVVK